MTTKPIIVNTIKQSNILTEARYDFTTIEKRIVYLLLDAVKNQHIDNHGNKTLWNNLEIRLPLATLKRADTKLSRIYQSLKTLRQKSLYLNTEDRIFECGWINSFEHVTREPYVTIEVSKLILPYIIELTNRYTIYSLVVAISLKTKYSQRFYEYCCQFRSSGFWKIKIDDLRERLMAENIYPRYSLLKTKVIEPARKELQALYDKNECDVCFTYNEKKSGRTVYQLEIFIYTKQTDSEQQIELTPEDYKFKIIPLLNVWMNIEAKPKNKRWVSKVIKQLELYPQLCKPLFIRINKMQSEIPEKTYGAYARHIIEEDYLSYNGVENIQPRYKPEHQITLEEGIEDAKQTTDIVEKLAKKFTAK